MGMTQVASLSVAVLGFVLFVVMWRAMVRRAEPQSAVGRVDPRLVWVGAATFLATSAVLIVFRPI